MESIRCKTKAAFFCHSRTSVVIGAATILASTIFSISHVANADVRVAHSTLVSENASFFTPGAVDGRVEAIAIEGDIVFVGGSFTQIQERLDGEILDQPYLFAYSKATGDIIRDFDPVLNGTVRALHTTGEGTGVFAGGEFTNINNESTRRSLVKLDNAGDRVAGFSARPDRRVFAMDRSGDTLYIGGNFRSIGPVDREFLAAVDTQTGTVLPNVDVDFDGTISTNVVDGFSSVDIIEVTSDDELMLVAGNFLSVNDTDRSRLALLELGEQATVSTWNTDIFDFQCPANRFPQYINGIDIAPDDSYFVTGTTGGYGDANPACDTILRFNLDDLTNTDAEPEWRTFTGGDSVYEVAATEHAVYTGGHFRWLNNGVTPRGDRAGPGAVDRRGFAALDPLNGLPLLDFRSDRNPRGVGVFALEVEPDGLHMGDDTDFLNGFRHQRLKFLPITPNPIIRPDRAELPTTIFNADADELDSIPFDGSALGTTTSQNNIDWGDARGAMFLGGVLFHADSDGNMWSSVLGDNGTFGAPTEVDLFGLTSGEWDLPDLGGMFFNHDQGRVYYSIQGDSRLFSRGFTPAGPLFGEQEIVVDDQSDIVWADVRGMDVIDGKLYFGRSDGNLYRATLQGSTPVSGSTELVSGPSRNDGRDWSSPLLAFSAEGVVLPSVNESQFEFEFAASADRNAFRTFEFEIQPDQPVFVRLAWDDLNANLNVFLRGPNGELLDFDNDQNGSSPKVVSAPVGEGGIYTVAVQIRSGSTAYTVSVNPSDQDLLVETDAQAQTQSTFEFSSTGSPEAGAWQIFNFDVLAGDLVEASVSWDNPEGATRVFLRDETGSPVDRDTDESGSPETVSATATNGGRWSVGVRVRSGTIDYNVVVNATRQDANQAAGETSP